MRRLLGVVGLLLVLIPKPAAAHPMGNFSINVHLGMEFREAGVLATLIIDMAEIPTFQEIDLIDVSGDGEVSAMERSNYAGSACSRHGEEVGVSLDGIPGDLISVSDTVEFVPGAAGLDTMRLTCGFQLHLANQASGVLTVSNKVFVDRAGWREMTAIASGFALDTDLPALSPSSQLTQFPEGPIGNRSNATIRYEREADAVVVAAPAQTFVERIGGTLEIGWLALASAAGLGVAHALAPGHGKTLMAAYLIGRRGKARQAVGLGMAVAVSHTVGVAALGMATVLTTSRFEPERVYPWLSIASAGLVTAIGAAMLIRALITRSRGHVHTHGHEHGPGGHSHDNDASRTFGWRSLAALGLAGGLVPSASAVVLLLGAVSKGDPWFGIGLVAAFGCGMAVALIAAGIGAVWAVRVGWRFVNNDQLRHRLERIVPALAGGTVIAVGLVLLVQATQA